MGFSHAVSAVGQVLTTQWPFILTIVVASTAVWLSSLLRKQDALSTIPLVGSDIKDADQRRTMWGKNFKTMYLEGYNRIKSGEWKGVLFRVPSFKNSPVLVVSPDFLNELKDLGEDVLNFFDARTETSHTMYTNIVQDTIGPFVLMKSLTPALSKLMPALVEEVDLSLEEVLQPSKDWTRVHLYPKLIRLVSRVSGHVFVGPKIARGEEYLDISTNYTSELFKARKAIADLQPSERPTKARGLKEVQAALARQTQLRRIIRTLITDRNKAEREDPDYQKPDDVMQYALDLRKGEIDDKALDDLVQMQTQLTFASIHSSSIVLLNAFYTLAVMPEVVAELREEVRTVVQQHGSMNGPAVQQMSKLDSFLREIFRMYPLTMASFHRKVMKPITLSNGQVIPAGVNIEVLSYAPANDPDLVPNPEKFDAFRHSRWREQRALEGGEKASAASSNQLVTTGSQNLHFGWGRHACPGRFFAAVELKLVLARVLTDYDVTMPDGLTERYPGTQRTGSCAPDTTKTLLFRSRAI